MTSSRCFHERATASCRAALAPCQLAPRATRKNAQQTNVVHRYGDEVSRAPLGKRRCSGISAPVC
jgi:hypothetical protein